MLVPSRDGCGNGKEDPQFGLFGAAYLTSARINDYGLKYYHFTVSDEPVVTTMDLGWLKTIYGDDVLDLVVQNGHKKVTAKDMPTTADAVQVLQKNAHAFFLQVNSRSDVKQQWTGLYGEEHVVMLPGTTANLHYVQACIIGLTEGVLDLRSAQEFLEEHGVTKMEATRIIRAVSGIPLKAQMKFENFGKLPKEGDIFANKTDLWPVPTKELNEEEGTGGKKTDRKKNWTV